MVEGKIYFYGFFLKKRGEKSIFSEKIIYESQN